MKKIYKLIFINILLIIFIFLISDFIFYETKLNNVHNFKENIICYIDSHKITDFDNLYKKKKEIHYFRDTLIKNSRQELENKKPSILIFGCSFGYGYLLREDQSFAYKLSQMSGRNVYNRSISSFGVQNMPYILEHFQLEKEILPPPSYIIFVLIEDHLFRQYRHIMSANEAYLDIFYENENNKLKEKKLNYFFYRFPIIRYIEERYRYAKYNKMNFEEKFKFLKMHFRLTKEIAEKKFPNAKIVILNYEDIKNTPLSDRSIWKDLEDEGFIVVHTSEITNEHLYLNKFRIPDDGHPNELAWDTIVPALVKRLDLTK